MGNDNPKDVTAALLLRAGAAIKRTYAADLSSLDPSASLFERIDAADMERRAAEFLTIETHTAEPLKIGAGGEFEPFGQAKRDKPGITAGEPDMVTAMASYARIELAGVSNVSELAADAAESIQAENSLEKMLVHQAAAAHAMAMRMLGKSTDYLSQLHVHNLQTCQPYSVEATRLANAAARLMDSYQRALLTLQKMRSGGQQTVTVQHQYVQVNDGGQAVVTGRVGVAPRVKQSKRRKSRE